MLDNNPTKTLPHRDPFLWVSRLISRNEAGTEGVVEYDVKEDCPVFKGHFPGNPILPGVIQIEAAAQACLWVRLGPVDTSKKAPQVLFVGVESYKFKRPVRPNCTLSLSVKQEKFKAGLEFWKVEIKEGGALSSLGHLWLKLEL